MDNTKVVVGGNVSGDITSCKIENQVIKVQIKSAFSLQQRTTYASYDVCSKRIINQYTNPEITGFGVFSLFMIGIFIFFISLRMIFN